ncbi:MAG: hypothetical protein J0M12_16535 [Deltaproteobacteria bacterium]|nr:hypothetical protein [Deltaproteobacteria bacterium]
MSMLPKLFLAIASLSLCACSARRPVLYPNEAFRAESKQTIDGEIDRCMSLAKSYTGDPSVETAKETAIDSSILTAAGAVTGTAIGAVTGNVGQGAAIGAISGAGGGVSRGVFQGRSGSSESGRMYRRFVERCLSERGLETIGWR